MIVNNDTDVIYDRFLRARKYDLDAAEAMLEACLKWRVDQDIRGLVSKPLEVRKMLVIRRCRPSSYVGFDKLGRPVV